MRTPNRAQLLSRTTDHAAAAVEPALLGGNGCGVAVARWPPKAPLRIPRPLLRCCDRGITIRRFVVIDVGVSGARAPLRPSSPNRRPCRDRPAFDRTCRKGLATGRISARLAARAESSSRTRWPLDPNNRRVAGLLRLRRIDPQQSDAEAAADPRRSGGGQDHPGGAAASATPRGPRAGRSGSGAADGERLALRRDLAAAGDA